MAHDKLYPLLTDPIPEVRASAVYALGTFISSVIIRSEHANNIDRSIAMNLLTMVSNDMSSLVRLELVAALQWMVIQIEAITNYNLKFTFIIFSTGDTIRKQIRVGLSSRPKRSFIEFFRNSTYQV